MTASEYFESPARRIARNLSLGILVETINATASVLLQALNAGVVNASRSF